MRTALVLAALVCLPALAAPRDPFVPYAADDVDPALNVQLPDVDLGALIVTGVVVGVPSPTALVGAPDGRTASLKVGDLVSRAGARVVAIRRDRVVVETLFREWTGRVVKEPRALVWGTSRPVASPISRSGGN
jgi:hypothetical protein